MAYYYKQIQMVAPINYQWHYAFRAETGFHELPDFYWGAYQYVEIVTEALKTSDFEFGKVYGKVEPGNWAPSTLSFLDQATGEIKAPYAAAVPVNGLNSK